MASPDEGAGAVGAEQAASQTPPGWVADGAFEVVLDPGGHSRAFTKWLRTGKLRSTFQWFLDQWKEPIDVRADKILDLNAFGRAPHGFLKMPRPKRPDEFPDGYEDRLKKDLERQFILRNLMRFVKTIDKGDPLEFEKRPVGVKLDLDARAHLKDLHRSAELVGELGADHARRELEWRHKFLEVMQWERYFCKEIKEDFPGPLWKHDPDKNPIPAKRADAVIATPQVTDHEVTDAGAGGSDT